VVAEQNQVEVNQVEKRKLDMAYGKKKGGKKSGSQSRFSVNTADVLVSQYRKETRTH
jgi:hypothetical protein